MATKKGDPNNLTLPCKEGENRAVLLAQASLRPSVQAALTIQRFDKANFAELGLTELVAALGVQVKDTIDGDTGRAEAMLISQAHTLNSIFCNNSI